MPLTSKVSTHNISYAALFNTYDVMSFKINFSNATSFNTNFPQYDVVQDVLLTVCRNALEKYKKGELN